MAIADIPTRLPKGTVESYESTAARRSNKKRSLRLTEWEIAELQDYWLGYAAEIGFRSVQGACETALLRSPPNKWTKRLMLAFLDREGGRAPEAKLYSEIVESAKNGLEIGLQRHEVKEALTELRDRGIIDRQRIEKPNGAGSFVELRLADVNIRTALKSPPSVTEVCLSAKERAWAAKDRELWLMWNEIPVKDKGGGNKGGSQVEWGMGGGHLGRSIASALDAMSDEGAAVLQAAYGTPPGAFGGAYGEGLGHVATMTASVRAERVARAKRAAAGRPLETAPVPLCLISGQPVYVNDALVRTREQLEAWDLRRIRPEDILRDKLGDDVFRKRVAAEAEAMLVKACAEYRKVRIRG